MSISRLYDFTPNTTILSSEVDAELNQLVSEVNLMLKKDGSEAMTGDLQIQKSSPVHYFLGTEVSGANWRIRENAGQLYFGKDITGYKDFIRLNFNTSAKAELIVGDGTQSGWSLIELSANTGDPILQLTANNSSSTRWEMYLDNSDSDRLKFDFGGVNKAYISSGSGFAIGSLFLTEVLGSSTPVANTLYPELIPKAWAFTNSAGTLQSGANLTVSKTGTGAYQYTFKRAMADANYCIGGMSTIGIQYGGVKSTTVFNIATVNSAGTQVDAAHHVFVIGTQ